MEFKVGQSVNYKNKESRIEEICADGLFKIANTDWDWNEEAECVYLDIEYDVPYWIYVKESELSILKF